MRNILNSAIGKKKTKGKKIHEIYLVSEKLKKKANTLYPRKSGEKKRKKEGVFSVGWVGIGCATWQDEAAP